MKSATTWNQLKQSIYKLAIAFSVAVIMLFTAAPAQAAFDFGTKPSSPEKGVTVLEDIYQKAEETLDEGGLRSMEQVQERAQKGINEVQGDADVDQMNRPSNSRQATTLQEKTERALEKATQKR